MKQLKLESFQPFFIFYYIKTHVINFPHHFLQLTVNKITDSIISNKQKESLFTDRTSWLEAFYINRQTKRMSNSSIKCCTSTLENFQGISIHPPSLLREISLKQLSNDLYSCSSQAVTPYKMHRLPHTYHLKLI